MEAVNDINGVFLIYKTFFTLHAWKFLNNKFYYHQFIEIDFINYISKHLLHLIRQSQPHFIPMLAVINDDITGMNAFPLSIMTSSVLMACLLLLCEWQLKEATF